jgi:hypothetical protein
MNKSKSEAPPADLPTDLPDDLITGITHGELRDLRSSVVENQTLRLELEEARRDQCTLCQTAAWCPATRRPAKGKLKRWQHSLLKDPTHLALCAAGKSREREFQREGSSSAPIHKPRA